MVFIDSELSFLRHIRRKLQVRIIYFFNDGRCEELTHLPLIAGFINLHFTVTLFNHSLPKFAQVPNTDSHSCLVFYPEILRNYLNYSLLFF